MLYERWRQIARAHQNELALRDAATGQEWSFGQLARVAEQNSAGNTPITFPQGQGPEFIFAVLQAWRLGQVVCPLEAGQSVPMISGKLPERIAHLKTTSATTQEARLIAFTGEQLASDAENIVTTMGLRQDWPNLGVISLAHSYGFSNLVLPLLLHGIPLIIIGSALPEPIRQVISSVPALTLPGVPALWKAWCEAKVITPNIHLAISAGAPLPVQLEQSVFEEHGLKIHNFYGSSECGGIAYDESDEPRRDGSCAGSALRNVQLSIAENGCLEVRSKAVGESYWPEMCDNLKDGRFRTSDLAEILDGVVRLIGRATDQINVAGRKVSPETIERVLRTHPQVEDCLVFGVPSPGAERVEEIAACVVGRATLDGEGLRQFLLAFLPAWQVPREWSFVESLSPNSRGKLSRKEWSTRFRQKNSRRNAA
jgi:acyl-CoA synthetase (AMP-forming)/AMP-acid ligase II